MAEKIIYDIRVESDDAVAGIDKLNTATKGLDASFEDVYGDIKPLTGRLGELEDRMYELAQAGDTTSKEFSTLSDEASRLKRVQKEVDTQLDRTSRTLNEKFSNAVDVASSSLVIAEGAMSALGVSSKTSEESMAIMVNAIAGAQALKSLNDTTNIFTSIGTAIKGTVVFQKAATTAQWLWNTAMAANPIGAVVAVIAALITAGYALITMFDDSTEAADKNTTAIKKLNEAIDEQTGADNRRMKQLKKQLKQELAMLKAQGKSKEEIRDAELKGNEKLTKEAEKQRNKATENLRKANKELIRLKAEGTPAQVEEQEKLVAKLEKVEKTYIDNVNGYIEDRKDLVFSYKIEDTSDDTAKGNKPKDKDCDKCKDKAKSDEIVEKQSTEEPEEVPEIVEIDEDGTNTQEDEDLTKKGEKYIEENKRKLAALQEQIDNEALMFSVRRAALKTQREAILKDATLTEEKRKQMLEKNANAREKIADKEKVAKIKAMQGYASAANKISALIGKETAAGKAAAIAAATINTYQGITAELSTKATTPLGIGLKIANVATVAAMGFKAVKDIIATPVPGDNGGGKGPLPTLRPSSPSFNVVGQSPASANNVADNANLQIENSNNNPTRAYVVSTDISNQQQLDRDIETDNSLG
jgi:hypothetical protein